jgi:hypothetical protein
MPLYLAVPESYKARPISNAIYLTRVRSHPEVLSTDPTEIEGGRNSGFGAVNLALLKSAKIIYLFGYDYGTSVYCPERYEHKPPDNEKHWPAWAVLYDGIAGQLKAAGVIVINASPRSTITAFPKVSIEKALLDLDRLRSPRSISLRGRSSFHQTLSDATDTDTRAGP